VIPSCATYLLLCLAPRYVLLHLCPFTIATTNPPPHPPPLPLPPQTATITTPSLVFSGPRTAHRRRIDCISDCEQRRTCDKWNRDDERGALLGGEVVAQSNASSIPLKACIVYPAQSMHRLSHSKHASSIPLKACIVYPAQSMHRLSRSKHDDSTPPSPPLSSTHYHPPLVLPSFSLQKHWD
jgi:hypothetical protein